MTHIEKRQLDVAQTNNWKSGVHPLFITLGLAGVLFSGDAGLFGVRSKERIFSFVSEDQQAYVERTDKRLGFRNEYTIVFEDGRVLRNGYVKSDNEKKVQVSSIRCVLNARRSLKVRKRCWSRLSKFLPHTFYP